MRAFFKTKPVGKNSYDLVTLLLRLGLGLIIVIQHGLPKALEFDERKMRFFDFMGLGMTTSLVLAIFAEVVCGFLLILGLFTRLAALFLMITMLVIVGLVEQWAIFGKAEFPFVLLLGFFSLLIMGPGRISLDRLIFK